jgi:hypothetical protein
VSLVLFRGSLWVWYALYSVYLMEVVDEVPRACLVRSSSRHETVPGGRTHLKRKRETENNENVLAINGTSTPKEIDLLLDVRSRECQATLRQCIHCRRPHEGLIVRGCEILPQIVRYQKQYVLGTSGRGRWRRGRWGGWRVGAIA